MAVAKTMLRAKRFDASIKALEQYLAMNPLDVDANLTLGQATGVQFGPMTSDALADAVEELTFQ